MTYFQGLLLSVSFREGPHLIAKEAADDRRILPRQTFRIPPGRWLPQWAELWSLPPLPCGRSQSQAGSLPRYLGVSGRYIWAIQRVVWANALFKKKTRRKYHDIHTVCKKLMASRLTIWICKRSVMMKKFRRAECKVCTKVCSFFCEESYQEGLHSLVGATQVAWIIFLLDC